MVPFTGFWPWQSKHSSLPPGLSGAPGVSGGLRGDGHAAEHGEADDQEEAGKRRRPEQTMDSEWCLSGTPLGGQ